MGYFGGPGNYLGQFVRVFHHDQSKRRRRGTHADDRDEEDQLAYQDPDKKCYHLCIVNLVIGTLYCAKGNYEFGISRIIKSLEPYDKKLGTDTWFHAKRCFVALAEMVAKQMVVLKDSSYVEIISFLDAADMYGKDIQTRTEMEIELESTEPINKKEPTVSHEARILKKIYLKLQE